MKQKGLGRGLDAIFGSDANPIDAKLKPMSHMAEIAIADIVPNPTQPRTRFDEEALDELAATSRRTPCRRKSARNVRRSPTTYAC